MKLTEEQKKAIELIRNASRFSLITETENGKRDCIVKNLEIKLCGCQLKGNKACK